MPRDIREVLATLKDIDNHVEPIAIRSPDDSDLHTIAYALHNLVICVRDVAEHVAGSSR
jgi:hypothetical protein